MTRCEAGLEKINTILTPALSLKEREKCRAAKSQPFQRNEEV
jgi:hypothetical protein